MVLVGRTFDAGTQEKFAEAATLQVLGNGHATKLCGGGEGFVRPGAIEPGGGTDDFSPESQREVH
jgi:hypothetical protein